MVRQEIRLIDRDVSPEPVLQQNHKLDVQAHKKHNTEKMLKAILKSLRHIAESIKKRDNAILGYFTNKEMKALEKELTAH